MVRYPPPWYLVSHRHICAIPHFATYRAIIVRYPPQKQARNNFAILSLQVSRDMKSIATGPLRATLKCRWKLGLQDPRQATLLIKIITCNSSLRAKGTLISEPRFSTPCEMRFFPTRERENGLFKEKPLKKAVFPFSRGKNRILQGVENRGSLISVPLALKIFVIGN